MLIANEEYTPWNVKYDVEVAVFRKLNPDNSSTFIWDCTKSQWFYRDEKDNKLYIPRYIRSIEETMKILEYLMDVWKGGEIGLISRKEGGKAVSVTNGEEVKTGPFYASSQEAVLYFFVSVKRWPR